MAMAIEEQVGVPEAEPAQLVINKLTNYQLSSNWDRVTGDLKDEFFVTIDDPDAGSNTIQYMSQKDYNKLRDEGKIFEWQYYATPAFGDDPADIKDLADRVKQEILEGDNVFLGDNEFAGDVTVNNLDVKNQDEVTPEELWQSQMFLNLDGEFRKVSFQAVYDAIRNKMLEDGMFDYSGGGIQMGDVVGQNMSIKDCETVLAAYGFPGNQTRPYTAFTNETASNVRKLGQTGDSNAKRIFSDYVIDKQVVKEWTVGGDVGNGLILGYTPCSGIINYGSSTFKSGARMSDKLVDWWTNGGGGTQNKSGKAWACDVRIYNHSSKSAKVKVLFGVQHSVEVLAGNEYVSLEEWKTRNNTEYPIVHLGDKVKITNRTCATASVPFQNIWYGSFDTKNEIENNMTAKGWTTAEGWNRLTNTEFTNVVTGILILNSMYSGLEGKATLSTKYGDWFSLNVWKVK